MVYAINGDNGLSIHCSGIQCSGDHGLPIPFSDDNDNDNLVVTMDYLSHSVVTMGYMSHSVVTIQGLSIPFYDDKGLVTYPI